MHQRTVVTRSFLVTTIGPSSLLFRLVSLQENLVCHGTRIRTRSALARPRVSRLAESKHRTAHLGLGEWQPPRSISQDITANCLRELLATSVRNRCYSGTLWHVGLLGGYLLTFKHHYIRISC